VARALERFDADPGVAPREATMVMLALFQGLMRQRRVDPEAVPDDLFARALRWLFSGLRSAHEPCAHEPCGDEPCGDEPCADEP
jgi:hypothetical protein